jgi:hypothetical protein
MENILRNALNNSSSIVIRKDLVLGALAAGLIVWGVAWVCIVIR